MNITLTVNLPPEVEERLRAESGDLSSAIRESFAVNLFRRGILTHHDLGQVLGLDRFETDLPGRAMAYSHPSSLNTEQDTPRLLGLSRTCPTRI